MRPTGILIFALANLLVAESALAFRCKGKLIKEGDPQAKVHRFCGEPASALQRTIYRGGIPRSRSSVSVDNGDSRLQATREELLIHDRSVVEVLVEEWTYNFGPHRLMRLIRFENGIVADIEGLSYGYLE